MIWHFIVKYYLNCRCSNLEPFAIFPAKPKEVTQATKDPKPAAILKPLEDVVNPYPITFESSGECLEHL